MNTELICRNLKMMRSKKSEILNFLESKKLHPKKTSTEKFI